jgi:hypothetical protein
MVSSISKVSGATSGDTASIRNCLHGSVALGEVHGERRIYYTAEAAEKAGREWIQRGG